LLGWKTAYVAIPENGVYRRYRTAFQEEIVLAEIVCILPEYSVPYLREIAGRAFNIYT
jgi:hypothetical protein